MHQTLLEMHLPEFRRGYQAGRKHGLAGVQKITDKDLLEAVYDLAHPSDGFPVNFDDASYTFGEFMGILSVDFIPMQDDENSAQEREQRFLNEIRAQAGTATLAGLIESFWQTQNILARLLPADQYKRMLCRDAPRHA